jgi:integrase
MKKEAKRALAEARRRTMTFGMVAKELTAAKEAAWRGTKHRERWDRNFNIHAAALTDVPVDQVNLEMVLKILKPMWLTKHETATKLRSQIERTLDYAEVSGYRTGDNPARLRGRLEHVLPNASLIVKRRHHPALPFQDMPAFVKKLKAVDRVSARMIEWGIYAACRPTEARLATRDELTPDRSTWVIPEGRMKEFNEHRVPVVGPALKLIERLAEREGTRLLFVAPRGGRLSDAAAGSLLKHMGFGHITQHGFRSSFRDWVGDTRKGDRDLAEEQLAHSIGSETERAYRRGDALDLRRSLMEDWAGYCLSAV